MKRAFTLIELLVVIAIIATLAAILFPVLANAKKSAKQAACATNLRELGLAVSLYVSDYDDVLPHATFANFGSGREGGWVYYEAIVTPSGNISSTFSPQRGSLYPYIKSVEIFKCPADSLGMRNGNSYGINACLLKAGPAGFSVGRPSSSFQDVAKWILFDEDVDSTLDGGGGSAGFLENSSTPDGYAFLAAKFVSTRHNLGSNLSFLDGHVKWYRPEKAIALGLFTGAEKDVTCPQPN